jgi:hypothetical protein
VIKPHLHPGIYDNGLHLTAREEKPEPISWYRVNPENLLLLFTLLNKNHLPYSGVRCIMLNVGMKQKIPFLNEAKREKTN